MSLEQSYLQRLRFDPKYATGLVGGYLRNFRLTFLLLLVILIGGLVSYFNIPQRLNPAINIPIVSVTTILPGASPADVESLVTIPIENVISGVVGVDTISSSSRENVSLIQVQFVSGVDPKLAEQDVKSAIEGVADLPDDAGDPQVKAFDFEDSPIWSFVVWSDEEELPSLMRFAKRLEEQIDEVNTVDRVTLSGYEEHEIQVIIEPEKLREYGLSVMQISQLVKRSVKAYPAGTVQTENYSFSFTIDPQVTNIEDIRSLRLSLQDRQITLGDIALIREMPVDRQAKSYLASNEVEARQVITFDVYKTRNADINQTADKVHEVVDNSLKEIDGRFEIETVVNTSDQIREQFRELLDEFATTVGLVFLCLFLFVGLRQAIIASFTVPLTFLSAFLIMPFFGMTVNFLTLFAFLLALGLLIDDTIVIISAMTTYYRTGKFTPYESGILVWRDFIVPIWSTTITTIWAFVPLLLSTGIIGEFIKPIPIVISIVMISSTAIAVLITLPLMIIVLKPRIPKRVIWLLRVLFFVLAVAVLVVLSPKNEALPYILIAYFVLLFVLLTVRKSMVDGTKSFLHKQENVQNVYARLSPYLDKPIINLEGLAKAYNGLILRVLDSRAARIKVVLAIVIFAVLSYALVPLGFVKNEFFPKTDEDRLYINVEYPAGINLDVVEEQATGLLEELRAVTDVEKVVLDVGRAVGGGAGSGGSGNNLAGYTLQLSESRSESSFAMAEGLRKKFGNYEGGTLTVLEESGGPPAGSDIQIELSGDDLDRVSQYADEVVYYLEGRKGLTNVAKSLKPGTSQIAFVPDMSVMQARGVTIDQVGLEMRTFVSGLELDSLRLEGFGSDEQEVVLKVGNEMKSLDDLGRLSIAVNGEYVPLTALGRFETQESPTQITRQNLKRTVTVTASVRQGESNVTDEGRELETFAATLDMPEGYNWSTGGVNEENTKSVQSIIQAMGLAFILILLTMVIQFGSFRQAFIALIVIPLAVSSVFFVFAITGTPLSFPALIGVLALFGIIVTNSMFIIDKINLNRREGMRFREAVADAGSSRLEPILLTKMATVLGLLPITISQPLWRGLGGAIIAGVLLASTFMLLFIPVVYYSLFAKEEEARDSEIK